MRVVPLLFLYILNKGCEIMDIGTNSRLFVVGMTGSGKTVFAKSLLHLYPRVVFHDRKGENGDLMQTLHFTAVHDPATLQLALQKGMKRILYQPAVGMSESMLRDDFDSCCEIIFKTTNCALFVDEVSSLVHGNTIPMWYGEIQRLGRSRNVGSVSLTQRPMDIPQTLLSESEYMFVFKLKLEQDCQKIASITGEMNRTISVHDWRIFLGLRDGDTQLSKAEQKDVITPVKMKDAIRDLPYHVFFSYDMRQIELHPPIPIK